MGKKIEFEGDEIAKDFEDNPNDWESVSEEEQNEMRRKLKNKEKRISLRVSADVLDKLRNKAAKEGLPYQTYINSLLFKIANDEVESLETLKERLEEVEKEITKIKAS